jgi:DNA-binding transcriptional ArsR family regulator
VGQLARGIVEFSKKTSKGLSLPGKKFIINMLYGLLKGQSVLLSEIARALEEPISLKKTIERLSRNLRDFDESELVIENYLEEMKKTIDAGTIYCLDPGDISKEYSRKQEGLEKIWDASKKRMVNGYKMVEVTALTHGSKLPIPVYTKTYSSKEADADILSGENLAALRHLEKHFGTGGIRVMDRGMDDVKIYRYCKNQQFIVRAKKNRDVIHNGWVWNIEDLANTFKGKIRLDHTDKYGKKHTLKIWHVRVELPEVEDQTFTLLVVHGYDKKDPEPCLLLTNMDANGKQKSKSILKIYLCRWRVEEYYRFKKSQFDLENIRVLSLKSIKTLNLLLSMLVGWIAVLSAKRGHSKLLEHIFICAKRIYDIPQFTLYATADGIFYILSKSYSAIKRFFKFK